MNFHHSEFLGGMAQPYLYGRPKNNPLARSSLVNTETRVDLAPATTMPLGVSLGLAEWDEGNRNLRLITHNGRSEEQTSELQSLMRTSYAVSCLKKNKTH